jgi:predicted Zn-dependent protease
VIDRDALLRALGRRGVAAWSLAERRQELATADHRGDRRHQRLARWGLVLHVDTPRGRGVASLDLGDRDLDVELLVDELVARAAANPGPPWTVPALAAPARVDLLDPALAHGAHVALVDVAAELADVAHLAAPAGITVEARAQALREEVTVETHGGLRVAWRAATLDVELRLRDASHSLVVRRAARRRADLDLAAALALAIEDLGHAANAGAPVAGRATLVLDLEAMLGGGPLGVWRALVDQADAVRERRGLTRVHRDQPIAPGADHLAEPLTIHSDGARPFGLDGAPVADDGAAVRAFALVDAGRGGELGLSIREAALRGRAPNGGVRNLLVAPGTWSGDDLGPRTIEVRRLAALEIAPETGAATLTLDLAIERAAGAIRPFRGGVVHLDLIAALARAARHRDLVTRGPYRGPRAIRLDDLELHD